MGKEPEIFTFGCRLNSYESEIIEQNLIEKGLKLLKRFKEHYFHKENDSHIC